MEINNLLACSYSFDYSQYKSSLKTTFSSTKNFKAFSFLNALSLSNSNPFSYYHSFLYPDCCYRTLVPLSYPCLLTRPSHHLLSFCFSCPFSYQTSSTCFSMKMKSPFSFCFCGCAFYHETQSDSLTDAIFFLYLCFQNAFFYFFLLDALWFSCHQDLFFLLWPT